MTRSFGFGLACLLACLGCDEGASSPALEREAPETEPDAAVDPEPPAPAAVRWCDGATTFEWDPFAIEKPGSFPDDAYTVDDPTTGTGLRVALGEEALWLEAIPGRYDEIYAAMNAFDGWGTSAAVFLRFDGEVSLPEEGKGPRLLDLGDDVPVEVPYETVRLDDGHTLALWPIWPLRPGTPHAVLIDDAFTDAAGDCIAPPPLLKAALTDTADDPRLARLAPRFEALLAQTETPPAAVGGALLFTTQSVHDGSAKIAADIAARDYRWARPPQCQTQAGFIRCEGLFDAWDYRHDDVADRAEPAREYAIPTSIWLPRDPPGGLLPVIIVGHGLGGDRSLGEFVARFTSNDPAVVVAIDAVAHGEHPAGVPSSPVGLLTEFFEVNLGQRAVNAPAMRDNFRQSTFDKLQLVQVLLQDPDIDGDGTPDIDTEHIAYFGVSLGGIMGSEFLALTDAVGAAVLGMPGGRLSHIMRDSASFAQLLGALLPPGATDADRERLFSAVQTVLDPGDPVNFAPRVLADRLEVAPGQGPQLLMVMAIDDAVVPNTTTETLARAYQLPLVRPFERAIDFLPEANAPVKGNFAGGAVSAGLFQYDEVRITGAGGTFRTIDADHQTVMQGRETLFQFLEFHRAWLESGTAEIIDPFEVLGVP